MCHRATSSLKKIPRINEHIEQMRLSATKSLLERDDAIIVATVSCIYGIGDPVDYHGMILHLREHEKISQREAIQRLAEMQYERNDFEFSRGTFRVRGDVLDIFPAESSETAVRVSLFDDEVESMTLFDPLTGRALRKVSRYTVYPSSHYVTPRSTTLRAIETIKAELRERMEFFQQHDKLVELQRIEQRTRFDLEMLNELGFCKGIENYSRHLSGKLPGQPPPTFMDYLPPGTLMVIDESHVTDSADRRNVQGRPFAEGKPGRVWVQTALGVGQPAAAVRRIQANHAANGVRIRDARGFRARAQRPGSGAGGTSNWAGGSPDRGSSGSHPGGRSDVGGQRSHCTE